LATCSGAALVAAGLRATPLGGRAEVFLTREQALAEAFAEGEQVETQTLYLTEQQALAIEKQSRAKLDSRIITRYFGTKDGRLTASAYFDTHIVRTMPETILVVVAADGTVRQVMILAFAEPDDYRPRPRWLERLSGHALDEELWPGRGIPRISGATLTTQAMTEAVRRVLAIHAVTSRKEPAP
jgi:FMN-binding domain